MPPSNGPVRHLPADIQVDLGYFGRSTAAGNTTWEYAAKEAAGVVYV